MLKEKNSLTVKKIFKPLNNQVSCKLLWINKKKDLMMKKKKMNKKPSSKNLLNKLEYNQANNQAINTLILIQMDNSNLDNSKLDQEDQVVQVAL
jgi:hypothetical protein